MPGNNTLPLIISATMQPTDHTSTGGGRLDDGEVGHANENGEKNKAQIKNNKQSETNTKRMAVEWCVELRMVDHAAAARYLRGSKHVDENVQLMTVQKASNKA